VGGCFTAGSYIAGACLQALVYLQALVNKRQALVYKHLFIYRRLFTSAW